MKLVISAGRSILTIVLLIFSATFFTVSADKADFHSSRLLVKTLPGILPGKIGHSGFAVLDRLNEQFFCSGIDRLFSAEPIHNKAFTDLGLDRIFVLNFTEPIAIDQAVAAYKNSGLFEYVEPDYIGHAGGNRSITPNDPYFSRQWGLVNTGSNPTQHPGTADADIDMDEAWSIEQGDPSIILGILDSGVNLVHPEFSGRIWTNSGEIAGNGIDDDNNGYIDDVQGWDFAFNDNDPSDVQGHGSNVSGVAAAKGNNSIGYAGVDWNCTVMALKILNDNNSGLYSWWSEAIIYATDHGANVLNMSVGGSSYSSTMETAINYAYANNVAVVVCMMNENNNVPYYPAAYQNTIAVGATDTDDSRCVPFFWGGGSNYGSHIDVVAPGNYIYGLAAGSTTNFNWYWGGTSQATPHVSGLATLLLAQDNTRTVDQIRQILRATAEDQVGSPLEDTQGWDQYYGAGRINAFAALNYITAIETPQANQPTSLEMYQNFPNPFNPATTFSFYLPQSSEVQISVFSVDGRKIATVADRNYPAGKHALNWRPVELASGVYLYRLQTKSNSAGGKLIYMK